MRIAVMGFRGQVATSLLERAGAGVVIVSLARPEVALEDRIAVLAGSRRRSRTSMINAAAYTAVDKAEAKNGWRFA